MQESLLHKSWPSAGIARINAETLFGNIRVLGHDSDEIMVSINGKAHGWPFFTANRSLPSDLDYYEITLEQQGNTLFIKTVPQNGIFNWLKFIGVNFTVLLPTNKGFESDFKTEAGNIRVENYLGDLKVKTGAGKIKLINVRGEVEAKTFAGTVDIRNCKADIKASTTAGTMEARNCEGSLTLSNSGGTMDIHEIVGNVYATTSAGSIDIHGVDGTVKVSTAAGTIDIKGVRGSLAALTSIGNIEAEVLQLGDFLSLETNGGNIKVDMPIDKNMQLDVEAIKVKAPRLNNFNGDFNRTRIYGQTGDNGIPVKIKARNGNVKIRPFQQDAFGSFEKTLMDSNFTLPSSFFQFDLRGFLLSFAICLLMTYGLSSIVFFSAEQITNHVMREVYTGIVLGHIMEAFGTVIVVYWFTQSFEQKISDNLSKYLILSVIVLVLGFIGQMLLAIFYWQFITLPPNATDQVQARFLYMLVPSSVACIYFFFWQRSKQITRKISEQEFQLVSLEKLKTKAELDALQARINPHFLYNALNSIAGLVHEDADKAEKMTMLLSKLFRFTIGTKDQHFNTVGNELEIVKTYLDIEQVRFGNRLSYTFDIENDIEKYEIPRFLLQPIVENAIKHGISKISGVGIIAIKMECNYGDLKCSIHDNGPAFADNFFTGYGLQSIQDKLKLLYGDKASLDIQNDDYKQVIIQLPC